jgi:hypothetical protein
MSLLKRALGWSTLIFLLCIVWLLFLNDPTQSLAWHLRRGNSAQFQGHQMTLPPMWRVNVAREDSRGSVLQLSRAAFWHPFRLKSGPESMTFASGWQGSQVIDDASAQKWRTHMVAAYTAQGDYASPVDFRGNNRTFYCFNRDDADINGGCLICRATGTDWDIVFGVGDGGAGPVQTQLKEARSILESMN